MNLGGDSFMINFILECIIDIEEKLINSGLSDEDQVSVIGLYLG